MALRFEARPLTPETFGDLEELFGRPGGSIVRGCWCMYYRRSGKAAWGSSNRDELLALSRAGVVPGLVGYLDDSPVGWISLGPREGYEKLQRSPIMKPVDDEPVWSIVCTFVDKPTRSHDDFMFFGSRSLYERAGFREVVRRSPTRVVMRRTLRPRAR